MLPRAMTAVYITIDTEYSAKLARAHGREGRAENFARSIACETHSGDAGVFHQMEVLEEHGCKGVFFVDPMPALVWGSVAIADIVEPICKRGHDVQLHLHTEWLELAGSSNPIPGRTGRNLHEFTADEQIELIGLAKSLLMQAGAPSPTAFRAGNYGANDDTLRALAQHSIAYDSSHVPGIAASDCRISLSRDVREVTDHHGVLEVPVGTVRSFGGPRHAQVTALSSWEITAALRHAVSTAIPMLNIVSHSFELLSRDRTRVNPIVQRRFAALCQAVAETPDASSATFTSRPPQPGEATGAHTMPHSEIRSAARMAEQFVANSLYGRE